MNLVDPVQGNDTMRQEIKHDMRETKKKDGKESHQVVKSLRQVASPNSEKPATIVFSRHCAMVREHSRKGMVIILASGECS